MSLPIVFNNGYNPPGPTNYVQALPYIPLKVSGSAITAQTDPNSAFASGMLADFLNPTWPGATPGNQEMVYDQFNAFLLTLRFPIAQGGHASLMDAFMSAWRASPQSMYLSGAFGGPPSLDNVYNGLASINEPFYQKGVDGLKSVMAAPADWSLLASANPPPSPPIDYGKQFIGAFGSYLKSIPAGSISADNFFTGWFNFTTTTCTIMASTATSAPYTGMPSYEEIYYTFHPGATSADFQNALSQFYTSQMTSKGFFIPSFSQSDWIAQNISQYNGAVNGTAPFALLGVDKSAVLNRVIRLLISMITTLQKLGVEQANQLKFLTAFQGVYTQLQTQIPVFTEGQKAITDTSILAPTGRSNTTAAEQRGNINSTYNASKTSNLQAFRSVQEDAAKQVQSRVNQTNDAVNQQTDMATSLIQQLSSLVGAIFR